jgi:hypothetical protein
MKIFAINGTLENPIGVKVGRVRGASIAEIKRRLIGARKDVLAIYNSIPKEHYSIPDIVNGLIVNRTVYRYEQDPQSLANIYSEIRETINRWMETGTNEKPARYFMDFYLDKAYNIAGEQSVTNIERITKSAGLTSENYEQILTSKPYFDRISNIRSRVFEEMKGFSGDTGADLARVLSDIVQDGTGITDARSTIANRFDVSFTRAERIARTEINRAYTNSRMGMTKQSREEYDLNIALTHISALTPTTRLWHAQRHGLNYTPEQQEAWWDEGANRVNCGCSVTETLLDDEGKPLNTKLQKKRLEQKEAYMAGR